MIGVDIAQISRIKSAINNAAFKNRVFTAKEQEYCDGRPHPENSYAGIFCAKEAASKAVGTGFGKSIMPLDIEVDHDALGAPVLAFHGNARAVFEKYDAHVSISHDGEYAISTVLLIAKQDR